MKAKNLILVNGVRNTDISVLELKYTKSFIYILTNGEGEGGGEGARNYKNTVFD